MSLKSFFIIFFPILFLIIHIIWNYIVYNNEIKKLMICFYDIPIMLSFSIWNTYMTGIITGISLFGMIVLFYYKFWEKHELVICYYLFFSLIPNVIANYKLLCNSLAHLFYFVPIVQFLINYSIYRKYYVLKNLISVNHKKMADFISFFYVIVDLIYYILFNTSYNFQLATAEKISSVMFTLIHFFIFKTLLKRTLTKDEEFHKYAINKTIIMTVVSFSLDIISIIAFSISRTWGTNNIGTYFLWASYWFSWIFNSVFVLWMYSGHITQSIITSLNKTSNKN